MSAHDRVRHKAWEILAEAFGERVDIFKGGVPATQAHSILTQALAEETDTATADEIAFHLVDWEVDAAFLVAFMLFPERFSNDEIQAAVDMLLIHVPAHVIAAARLGGHAVKDSFADGAGG